MNLISYQLKSWKKKLDRFIKLITHILNLSLKDGEFHDEWKNEILWSLQKKSGIITEKSNYRPVSKLEFLAIIVENCVLNQYTQHLSINCINLEHQSTYKIEHHCETALLKNTNDILWSFEQQNVNGLLMMDLSSAFDTVDHNDCWIYCKRSLGWEKQY